jgi:hypothetical protein
MTITALDPADDRQVSALVAGPTALLVAKLHKLHERRNSPDHRRDNKDAMDVYRLLRYVPTETFAEKVPVLLSNDRAREVTHLAVGYLRDLFGTPDALGSQMAGQSVEAVADPAEIAAACAFLADDLLTALAREPSG